MSVVALNEQNIGAPRGITRAPHVCRVALIIHLSTLYQEHKQRRPLHILHNGIKCRSWFKIHFVGERLIFLSGAACPSQFDDLQAENARQWNQCWSISARHFKKCPDVLALGTKRWFVQCALRKTALMCARTKAMSLWRYSARRFARLVLCYSSTRPRLRYRFPNKTSP